MHVHGIRRVDVERFIDAGIGLGVVGQLNDCRSNYVPMSINIPLAASKRISDALDALIPQHPHCARGESRRREARHPSPRSVPVHRGEVVEAVGQANRDAAAATDGEALRKLLAGGLQIQLTDPGE